MRVIEAVRRRSCHSDVPLAFVVPCVAGSPDQTPNTSAGHYSNYHTELSFRATSFFRENYFFVILPKMRFEGGAENAEAALRKVRLRHTPSWVGGGWVAGWGVEGGVGGGGWG